MRKIKDKNLFDENTYKKVYPCGCKPANIYGLSKTDKMLFDSDDFSLQPIISPIDSYNYNLDKFLTELLNPVIPKEHCNKNYFSFCEEIQHVSSNDNFWVSYDVWSLFTSISLQETIQIAVELIFENNPWQKATKCELKQLFNFATSGTHFTFNGSFYDQIDGVSMGSPLGPVLANFFMGYHEKNGCKNLTKERFSGTNIMLIFFVFGNEKDAENFFEFLNCQHKPFFNIVYWKKTSIELFTQFNGFTPMCYKIDLVRCLIHWAFEVNSWYIIFHNELEKILLKFYYSEKCTLKALLISQDKT